MSFLRWDVLLAGFVLALPVLLLGMRGDLPVPDMTARLPWCLLAGWVVVSVLRWASTPPTPHGAGKHPDPQGHGLSADASGAEHESSVAH